MAALLMLGLNLQAQTTVSSIISADETWTPSGSPYEVTHNVLIDKGVKVKVMPGTKIRATGPYRIIVSGTWEARGTADSVITIDTCAFEFTNDAVGYNFTSKKGSVFSYCNVQGNGMASYMCIQTKITSLLISNCKFRNTYYTIYGPYASGKDTATVRIEKSFFDLGAQYGSVIYPSGNNAIVEIDQCTVLNMGSMFLAERCYITRSTFTGCSSYGGIRISRGKRVVIACNSFKKFRNSVLEIMVYTDGSNISITENTFDSTDNFMDIYSVYGIGKTTSFKVEGNNFLKYNKNSVLFHASSSPGKKDTFVFPNNYWGSSSSSTIDAGIFDFKDDITVPAQIDYTGYLSSPVSNCTTLEGVTQQQNASNHAFNISQIGIYPNPASTHIRIENMPVGKKEIKIISITGKVIKTQVTIDASANLNLTEIAAGSYYVVISENGLKLGAKQIQIVK